jgi:hypothetical protein
MSSHDRDFYNYAKVELLFILFIGVVVNITAWIISIRILLSALRTGSLLWGLIALVMMTTMVYVNTVVLRGLWTWYKQARDDYHQAQHEELMRMKQRAEQQALLDFQTQLDSEPAPDLPSELRYRLGKMRSSNREYYEDWWKG